jgi:hypothetical protein
VFIACAFALALAGCGAGENPAVDMGATTSVPPLATTTQDLTNAGPFTTTEVSTPPAQRSLLTNVRTATQNGFVRATFEFRDDAVPGYRVSYATRPVTEDGSGTEVKVAGSDVLLVHFEPASAVELKGNNANQTYTGPRRIPIDGGVVREAVRVGDFEANLNWALGVEGRRAFRVFALHAPARVVVDVSTS